MMIATVLLYETHSYRKRVPMRTMEHRTALLRAEIEHIKGYLLIATDETERLELSIRLTVCLRESIALINQRLQLLSTEPAALNVPLRERHAGDPQ